MVWYLRKQQDVVILFKIHSVVKEVTSEVQSDNQEMAVMVG